MDKKGFIRTLEAVISVILLFGFMFFMKYTVEPEATDVPFVVENSHNFIFEEMAYNVDYRDCILNRFGTGSCDKEGSDICMQEVNSFVLGSVPDGYSAACEVCASSMSCYDGPLPIDRNIYANSLFIASDNPKIMRIYFWERD